MYKVMKENLQLSYFLNFDKLIDFLNQLCCGGVEITKIGECNYRFTYFIDEENTETDFVNRKEFEKIINDKLLNGIRVEKILRKGCKFMVIKEKDLKRNFSKILKVNYCDLSYLLNFRNVLGHTEGVYGWNSDIYKINDEIAISTGYRPVGNIKVDMFISRKYNEKARDLFVKYSNYDEEFKKQIDILLTQFLTEILIDKESIIYEYYNEMDKLNDLFLKIGDHPYFSEDYVLAKLEIIRNLENKYNIIFNETLDNITISLNLGDTI